MNNSDSQMCFIKTLGRLRESSRDAVVMAEASDPYTMYMHVERKVHTRFIEILKETYNTDHAELILLCGSVGDGKSHILSHTKTTYPEMMSAFVIHNDATASLYVDEPASFTLMKLMEDFSDDKIDHSSKKLILAINLGTLTTFLEADTDNKFSRLKQYVNDSGILERSNAEADLEKYFHNVNFADYHLYDLTEDGPQSEYIQGLLHKITHQKKDNIYYTSYCNCCKNCESYSICPIRANYELLSDENIQKGVIRVLVESIVKNKLIVSTRKLLNFFYEILVDERLFDRGSLTPKKEPENIKGIQYCEALLPNMIFERTNSSDIFEAMAIVDPLRVRNEAIDEFFVYFENDDQVVEIWNKEFAEYSSIIEKIKQYDYSEPSIIPIKRDLLKTYIRLCCLSGKKTGLVFEDNTYVEYMKALYSWNIGDAKVLKNVYDIVRKGALSWNGYVGSDEMQLPIGNDKTKYHLVQEIKLSPNLSNLPKHSGEVLYSFSDRLVLQYKLNNSSVAEIEVDYSLYSLLKSVVSGYIPSVNEKRLNVKCADFIRKISQSGKKSESIMIRDNSDVKMKEYRIESDGFGGYNFEVTNG